MNTITSIFGIPADLIKGTLSVFIFKVLGAISALLVNIIIANYYDASALGRYNLVLTSIIILGIIGRFGLDTYSVRIIPTIANDHESLGRYLNHSTTLIIGISIILSIIWWLVFPLINEWFFKKPVSVLGGVSLALLPYVFFTFSADIFRALKLIKTYAILRNMMQPFLVVFILSMCLAFNQLVDPVIILYVTIGAISIWTLILLRSFSRKQKIAFTFSLDFSASKSILSKAYPMLLASSSMFLLSYLDHFVIGYFHSEKEVGLYAACSRISMLLAFLLNAINSYTSPQFSANHGQKNVLKLKEGYWSALRLNLLSAVPFLIILILFPTFFLGLFGEEFYSAKRTLLMINIAFFISAACGPVGTFMNMTDLQHLFMWILLIALLINLILNIFLVPKWGIEGAAFATLISTSIWNISGMALLKQKGAI